MSQDEALRLTAEVVDKSTGPLNRIAGMLRGVAKEGQEHGETLAKGFGRAEAALAATAKTASSVLTPALATVGITGLTLTATIAGIGAAIKNFGGAAKDLGQLSRDTGIGASQLREVQGILGSVGVDAGTSSAALQQFAENSRLALRGYGPLIEFLRRQGRDEAGRRYFNDLADDMIRSKDAGEVLSKAIGGLEGIKDPTERRIYAENILKMADAARLADGRLGSLREQVERFRRNNGVLTDKDIADAEAYARSMDALKGTMNKLYDSVARELTPNLTEAAKALKGFIDNERNGVSSALVTGIRDIRTELAKIDWKQAGADAVGFLRETTALAGALAGSIRTIVAAMKAWREGDYSAFFRATTGGEGTVGAIVRKVAPAAGDDEIEARHEVDLLRRRVEQPTLDFESGLAIDIPSQADGWRQQLAEAEARLKKLQARTPEQRTQDFNRQQSDAATAATRAPLEARIAEIQGRLGNFDAMRAAGPVGAASEKQAEDLRREMARLTEELKRVREGAAGGATEHKMSFDGTGTGIGGLIHTASFGGGFPAIRRMLQSGQGIYAPGGGGYGGAPGGGGGSSSDERGGEAGRILREHRRRGDGDRLYGSDPGAGGRPRGGAPRGPGDVDIGDGMRGRPFGAPKITLPGPDSPAGRVGRHLRGDDRATPGAARTGQMMAWAMDQLRQEGVPEDQLRTAAAHLVGQAHMESGLDPNKTHDVDRNGNPTGFGIYGARDPKGWGNYKGARRSDMVRWLEANGYARNSAEGQMREMAHRAMSGQYRRTREILMGRGTGNLNTDTNTITGEFESPAVINNRSGAVRNAYRVGPEAAKPPAAASDGDFFPNGAPRVLKPDSMKDDPSVPGMTMEEANRRRAAMADVGRRPEVLSDPNDERRRPGADPSGMDDDDRAARDLGASLRSLRQRAAARAKEREADPPPVELSAASRAALGRSINGGSVSADGRVHISVQTVDPKPKVQTGVSGPLFKEITQERGRQMDGPAGP